MGMLDWGFLHPGSSSNAICLLSSKTWEVSALLMVTPSVPILSAVMNLQISVCKFYFPLSFHRESGTQRSQSIGFHYKLELKFFVGLLEIPKYFKFRNYENLS